jgi:phosphoribosylamine--glycine ligase/phosphoribosylformylglycinamidine cyclo-ligase
VKSSVWIVMSEEDLEAATLMVETKELGRQELQLHLMCKALQFTAQSDAKVAAAIEKGLFPMQQDRVLVIGAGGREHAIVHKLSQSPRLERIYVSSGNYGTAHEGLECECVNVPALANEQVAAFVKKHGVALVVVGPEQPLVEGLADMLAKEGIPCFGPSQRASVIEASKAWSKDFMQRHGIRTAQYGSFTDFASAKSYIEAAGHRVVVKASGIAAGKGVLIPTTVPEAVEGARSMLEDSVFGEAGSEVVIEEFLEGEEVSVLAFCDGTTAVGMPPAQDHKRALDGDKGLNTGGMGCYAPTPLISEKQYQMCMDIVQVRH